MGEEFWCDVYLIDYVDLYGYNGGFCCLLVIEMNCVYIYGV